MKRYPSCLLIEALILMLICSCTTLRPVTFADRAWHISTNYGQIIDSDTTWRLTFGDVPLPENMPIISCADSAAKYSGMDRFLGEILQTVGLADDEVLFYSPAHGKVFVRLLNEAPAKRPSSISVNMCDERPYTMWIYEDDAEDWHRRPGEMYTYTYFDGKRERILVVDYYDYGTTPVAQIFVLQSRNKKTDRMQMPGQGWDFSKHRLRDYRRDIEFWSHLVDGHRRNAFANYRIGQEQLNRQK